MGEVIVLVVAVLFLVVIILSSRFFYAVEIKRATKKQMSLLQFDVLLLNYSFEQMVYLYPLPSSIPTIKHAKKKHIFVEYDYKYFLTQYIRGLNIYIKYNHQTIHLAYLSTNDLRFPTLDLFMKQGKLDEGSYLKIATYRLTHPSTIEEIINEVYQQMKTGRYEVDQLEH